MQQALNLPFGGGLVHRVVSRQSFNAGNAGAIPQLKIDEVTESDLINLATGIYSPLNGFMGSKELESVCTKMRLVSPNLPWTIPIILTLFEDEKKRIEGVTRVALVSSQTNEVVGFIEPTEISAFDKDHYVLSTFGTRDGSHPGVRLAEQRGPYLLAGPVTVFQEALSTDELFYPTGIRRMLERAQVTKIAGFQTRNVVHRAHEYLQRVALEVTGALLVHPVVGWKKAGDFKAEVVQHAYRAFMSSHFPKDKVFLAFLKVAMRYAGPKEAVFHAIIRKNFGCSHFIVGRDHAGVGNFYSTYAAHEIFETLPDLGIEILRLREPFYCGKCGGIATDRTCGHSESEREFISGTKIRGILKDGVDPRNQIFRTEVLESLKPFYDKGLFYE